MARRVATYTVNSQKIIPKNLIFFFYTKILSNYQQGLWVKLVGMASEETRMFYVPFVFVLIYLSLYFVFGSQP